MRDALDTRGGALMRSMDRPSMGRGGGACGTCRWTRVGHVDTLSCLSATQEARPSAESEEEVLGTEEGEEGVESSPLGEVGG